MASAILLKNKTEVKIEQLKETKSMFNLFSSKNTIISFCIYKSLFYLLLNDGMLIIYDPLNNTKKYEIDDVKVYKPTQIAIIFYNKSQVKKDYILFLSENKLIVMNFSNYTVSYEQNINPSAMNMKIHAFKDLYLVVVTHKNKLCLYNIVQNSQSASGFSFYLYYNIDTDEQILTKDILLNKNFIAFETKNKINFYTFDSSPNKENVSFFFSKSDNFSSEMVSFPEARALGQYLLNSNLKNKNIEAYKNIQFEYSNLSNVIFMSFLNKIFLIQSVYCPKTMKFIINSTHTKLEIIDKVTKANIIQNTFVKDPYFILITDQKIYIYFIFDIQRCIESAEIDISFDLLATKQIFLLNNLSLLNYEYDIIQYNDIYLVNEMKNNFRTKNVNNQNYIMNSAEFGVYMFSNDTKVIEWVNLSDINTQMKRLKSINIGFVNKLLCSYKENANWNEYSLIYWNSQLVKSNEKFILLKSLELIYNLITNGDYANALICIKELNVEMVFIIILIRKIIKSPKLILLIEYFFKSILGKFLVVANDDNYDESTLTERMSKEIEGEFKSQNENFLNLIKDIEIKSFKELPMFLKFFFNNFIEFRNLLKMSIPKEPRKQINFIRYYNICQIQLLSKKININEIDSSKSSFFIINSFTLFNDINESFNASGISEDQIKFCIIENVVFILNFYAYKITKQAKYTKNLQEMIKYSFNILDPSITDLLSEIKLEKETLLYYFKLGNYQKCLSNITSIYDSISTNDSISEQSEIEFMKDELIETNSTKTPLNDEEELNKSYSNEDYDPEEEEENEDDNRKNDKGSKMQWLICYISLLCKIKNKISELEFDEYLNWALDKNSMITIDSLLKNKIISDKEIDEKFIGILKEKGIDPVIYYLQKFVNLEENETQSNEMVNLYTIKIKLLQEAIDKNPSLVVKFKYEIRKARDELCNFLITNKNYNITHAFDKISEISICQKEIGIVLIKQNNYEEGIEKLFIDESPMKMILILVENNPDFDLIYMIIKKLLNTNFKFVDEDGGIEDVIIMILSKIQFKCGLLIKLLNTDLFDDLECEKLTEFFIKILNTMEGTREKYKIESSFVESDFISSMSKLYDVQNVYHTFINDETCAMCHLQFVNDNTKGVIGKDGQVYHEKCFDMINSHEI